MTHRSFRRDAERPSLARALRSARFPSIGLGSLFLVAVGCSPADPVAANNSSGNATQGNDDGMGTDTGMDVASGVSTSVVDGMTIYTDEDGQMLTPMVIDNGDGTTTTVLTDPTGATVGEVPMTPETDDSVVVDEGDDQLIEGEVGESMTPAGGELVDGVVCASSEVSFEPVIPTVMLLIDRSASMFSGQIEPYGVGSSAPFGEYPDRWEALRAAVNLLEPFSSDIQFGALTYTGFKPENGSGMCPVIGGSEIALATDNFADIQAILPVNTQAIPEAKSETPTAEGIVAATEALVAVESDGPKYIVLITDGLPEMCGYFDMGVWCGHDPSIGAVQAAHAQGIETFVIGIGFPDASSNENDAAASEFFLNSIAHAGQGLPVIPPTALPDRMNCILQESILRGNPDTNNTYWNGGWADFAVGTYGPETTVYSETLYLSPEEANLGTQLSQVVEGVRSCSFEMGDNVVRAQAGRGAVRLTLVDGTFVDLTYQDANGWDLDPVRDDLVVVQGTACEQVQNQDQVQSVKIEFPCDIRIPKAR